jgi:hypothetical protein
MDTSHILAELLPRIIPVSKEDIHVRRNPTFYPSEGCRIR